MVGEYGPCINWFLGIRWLSKVVLRRQNVLNVSHRNHDSVHMWTNRRYVCLKEILRQIQNNFCYISAKPRLSMCFMHFNDGALVSVSAARARLYDASGGTE